MNSKSPVFLTLRVTVILILCITLRCQYNVKMNPSRPDPRKFEDLEPEHFTESDFNRSLPYEKGDFDESEIENAEKFFHLPITLSRSFISCQKNKEHSCFELLRAYKLTNEYISLFENRENIKGYVIARLPSKQPLSARMSSFYNAFLIAMFTKRRLILDTDEPDIVWLHSQVKPLFAMPINMPTKELDLPSNFTFSCEDVNYNVNDFPALVVHPGMWAQISYIHPYLASRIRSVFGFHAAYYICNFLFNEFKAMIECGQLAENSVACAPHRSKDWSINTNTFQNRMVECLDEKLTVVMIEDNEESSDAEQLCMMKKLISADKIVYTFGSVLGWMAMAMQGGTGAAVDLNGQKCMEMRVSQAGSLIHTYNPKKIFHYVSNNDFLLCGPNYNDARLYERYLMW